MIYFLILIKITIQFLQKSDEIFTIQNKDKSIENIEEKNDSKLGIKLFVNGEDTTFILNNKKNRVIATKYELNVDDNRKFIYLENQDMKFTYMRIKMVIWISFIWCK